MVAYANNGIVKKLYDKEPIELGLDEKSSPEEYYKAYLSLLHIDIKDNDLFKKNSESFLEKAIVVSKILIEKDQKTYYSIELDDFINTFDYYYFMVSMQDIIDNKIKVVFDNILINKIINDLKEVYELVKEENYKLAFDRVQAIIERNKKMYERLS